MLEFDLEVCSDDRACLFLAAIGLEGGIVEVKVDLNRGLPGMKIADLVGEKIVQADLAEVLLQYQIKL